MDAPKWLVSACIATGTGLIGLAVGYKIGKRNASFIYVQSEPRDIEMPVEDNDDYVTEIILDEESAEEVRAMQNPIIVDKLILDAETKELIDAQRELKEKLRIQELEKIKEKDREIKNRPEQNNVFTMEADTLPEWDYEYELPLRKDTEPYVIHKDEFMVNENEYNQETLTFYAGDEIMATQADEPLYGWFDMIGTLRWGYGSDDSDVVYIRNPVLHMEWEVIRHPGRFEVEVGGLTLENEYEQTDLKHSNSLRKFREF